jgi:hypothetical protein
MPPSTGRRLGRHLSFPRSHLSSTSTLLFVLLALWILALSETTHGAPPNTTTTTTVAPPTVSSTPVPPPTPSLNLTYTTTCASFDGGSWIIGAGSNGQVLTFIKAFPGSTSSPIIYSPTGPLQPLDPGFAGGKCFEANSTTLYYISDSHSGYVVIGGTTSNSSTWNYSYPQNRPPSTFPVSGLIAGRTAVGREATAGSNDVVVVTVLNMNILLWNVANGTTAELAALKE